MCAAWRLHLHISADLFCLTWKLTSPPTHEHETDPDCFPSLPFTSSLFRPAMLQLLFTIFFLLHFCVQWADGCFVCVFVCFRNKVRRGPVHSNTPSREKWLKCDIIKKKNLKQILNFCFSDLLCSLYYYTITKIRLSYLLFLMISFWCDRICCADLCLRVFFSFLFICHFTHTFCTLFQYYTM